MKRICKHAGTIIVLLPALLLVACSDLFMDEQKSMQLARDYLASGDITAGAIELRNALTDNPDNAEARYRLASIYLDFGDFPTAVTEYKRALSSGWDEAEAIYGLVRAELGMGDFQSVIDDGKVKDAWPATLRAEILSTRALANAALQKLDEAFTDLENAQALDAVSSVVLRTGIQLQIVEGAHEDAVAALQQALVRYPDDQELLLLQARMLAASDQAAAEKYFEQVMALDPEGFITATGRSARRQLVQLMILQENFERADQLLRPLFRLDKRDPFTNYLGGVIAFRQNDLERASQLLLKVLKLAPEHNPTRLLFGTVSYAEGNYEQAAYFLSKYISAVPDNLVARKLLARSYIILGRNAEAHSVLQQVMTDGSNDSELLALAGMSELNMGRTAAGIAGLKQAVTVNPGNMELRSELARAYITAGETGLAIEELRGLLAAGGEQQQTETLLVIAHLRAGDYARAIDQVLGNVSRSPNDPAVQTLAGVVFAASEDFTEARAYILRALELQPGFLPATMSLGHLEEREGNYESARKLYEQLVEAKAESVLPMLALARVAEQQNNKTALLDWLERALEYAPGDIKPRIFLAEYHLREGELIAAGSYVREALEMFPDEPELLVLSGRVNIAGKQYRKALQPLGALVRLEPESTTGHLLLAESHLQLEQFDDARRELLLARDTSPDAVPVLAMLVRLEIKVGDFDQALLHSQRIREVYPELFLGYELAGDSYMAIGRFDEADREYLQAWERMQSAGLLIKRSENANRAGKTDIAIGLLQDWLQLHTDDAEVAQFLGNSLQNAGRVREAAAVYEKVIAIEPENAVALNNLAGLYMAEGRPGALELAKRAWLVDEGNPGIQDTYGWALVQAGRVGRGLELLRQASTGLPNIPEVSYHHAVALYRAGDKQEARRLLEELLRKYERFDGREDAEQLVAGDGG